MTARPKPTKASGFTDKYKGQFWVNERGKLGVRYQCKTCGRIVIGTSGLTSPLMHLPDCKYMEKNRRRP